MNLGYDAGEDFARGESRNQHGCAHTALVGLGNCSQIRLQATHRYGTHDIGSRDYTNQLMSTGDEETVDLGV